MSDKQEGLIEFLTRQVEGKKIDLCFACMNTTDTYEFDPNIHIFGRSCVQSSNCPYSYCDKHNGKICVQCDDDDSDDLVQ